MTESKPTRGHYTFVHQFNVECDRRGIANCGGYSPSHGQHARMLNLVEETRVLQRQKEIIYKDSEAELTKLREERKAMCWALTSIRSMSQPGAVLNPAKTIETIRNIANDAVEALAKHKQSDEKGG